MKYQKQQWEYLNYHFLVTDIYLVISDQFELTVFHLFSGLWEEKEQFGQ